MILENWPPNIQMYQYKVKSKSIFLVANWHVGSRKIILRFVLPIGWLASERRGHFLCGMYCIGETEKVLRKKISYKILA